MLWPRSRISGLGGESPWRSSGSANRCGGSRISGFITGQGRYTDDIDMPGQAYRLRAALARRRMPGSVRIDTAAAKAAPGVLLVITGADIEASGGNLLPCFVPMHQPRRHRARRPGAPDPVHGRGPPRRRPCRLRGGRDARAGQGRGRADRGRVRRSCRRWPTPSRRTGAGCQPQVHPEAPGNLAFDWHFGDEAAVARGVRQGRPRGQARAGQQPGDLQRDGAARLRRRVGCGDARAHAADLHPGRLGAARHPGGQSRARRPSKVRVLTPDVGGGFGMKAFFYPEYTMAACAARALGRPVKWTGERGESFLSDVDGPRPRHHGRARLRRRAPHPGHAGRH